MLFRSESGAILIYLGEKHGRFLPGPDDIRGRKTVLEWLMWQMGGLGPMAGQAHHFRQAMGGVEVPYGIERYSNEVRRLYAVMERRLAATEWLGGADYSIADMACWPWIRGYKAYGIDLKEFANLRAWFKRVGARPAVERAANIGKEQFIESQKRSQSSI